jgi:hypothetical protein
MVAFEQLEVVVQEAATSVTTKGSVAVPPTVLTVSPLEAALKAQGAAAVPRVSATFVAKVKGAV